MDTAAHKTAKLYHWDEVVQHGRVAFWMLKVPDEELSMEAIGNVVTILLVWVGTGTIFVQANDASKSFKQKT